MKKILERQLHTYAQKELKDLDSYITFNSCIAVGSYKENEKDYTLVVDNDDNILLVNKKRLRDIILKSLRNKKYKSIDELLDNIEFEIQD